MDAAAIGIDFGTTNTVIALAGADGEARLVSFAHDDEAIVAFRSALAFHAGVHDANERVVEAEAGRRPELSTTGGTSDARFIRALCPVVELGLVGATMHAVDERTPVAQIEQLTAVYRRLIRRYFETFS